VSDLDILSESSAHTQQKKERKKERKKGVCLRSRFSSFLVKSSFNFFRQFLRSSSLHLGVEFLSVIPFHRLLLVHRERYIEKREEKRREEKSQTDKREVGWCGCDLVLECTPLFFSLSLACVEFLLKI